MIKKITGILICMVLAVVSMPVAPAFADNTQQDDSKCVSTSIIQNADGKYCDDGGGGGVWAILNIGLTVLTFGVGIAATAGLVICGIKYATSGTNEAQATNARRRIFEIVIGLIAYAVLYAALNWLIPGFSTADTSMTAANSPYKTTRVSTPNNSSNSNISSTNKSSQKSTNKTSQNTAKAAEAREVAKLLTTVKRYTWSNPSSSKDRWKDGNTSRAVNKQSTTVYGVKMRKRTQGEQDCGAYLAAMMIKSGYDKSFNRNNVAGMLDYMQKSSRWKEVPRSSIQKVINAGGNGNSALKPGDVVVEGRGHIVLYVGQISGFTNRFTEASYSSKFTGRASPSAHSIKKIYEYLKGKEDVRVFRRVFN